MNVSTSHAGAVAIVTVNEPRLTYPLLTEFAKTVTDLIEDGERKIVIDLTSVGYVDSATIGCLMDLYRQALAAEGMIKLACVQKRVATMLTMTGAHNFLEVHLERAAALQSFGG